MPRRTGANLRTAERGCGVRIDFGDPTSPGRPALQLNESPGPGAERGVDAVNMTDSADSRLSAAGASSGAGDIDAAGLLADFASWNVECSVPQLTCIFAVLLPAAPLDTGGVRPDVSQAPDDKMARRISRRGAEVY